MICTIHLWLIEWSNTTNAVYHCSYESYSCATKSASSYTVVAGEFRLNSYEGTEQSRPVCKVIRHPNYNT
jgi:hypothetical protein